MDIFIFFSGIFVLMILAVSISRKSINKTKEEIKALIYANGGTNVRIATVRLGGTRDGVKFVMTFTDANGIYQHDFEVVAEFDIWGRHTGKLYWNKPLVFERSE